MNLVRYPDGARHWTLFIWSRHPQWSLTWTHSLSLSLYRRSSGVTLWPWVHRHYQPADGSQWGWSVRALRFELSMQRQKPMGENHPGRVLIRLARMAADAARREPPR